LVDPEGHLIPADYFGTLHAESVRQSLQWSWERNLDMFDAIFGSEGIHYTLAPIYDSLKLPPKNDGEDWTLKVNLRAYGNDRLHGRYFGLQTNGLDDGAIWSTCTSPSPKFEAGGAKRHWRLIENQSCQKFTALQTRARERLYEDIPQDAGDPCAETCARGEVWMGMFENIKALSVDAVEVYEPDVKDRADTACACTQVRDVLEDIHAWLTTPAP
jgi:hypothetical protein